MYQGGDCKFSCTPYPSDASLVTLHELHQERWQTVVTQDTWVVVRHPTLEVLARLGLSRYGWSPDKWGNLRLHLRSRTDTRRGLQATTARDTMIGLLDQ